MAVLIDTGFYVAFRNERDPHHERAVELAKAITSGHHGQAFVTDYVIAETLNYAGSRLRSPQLTLAMMADLLGQARDPWMGVTFVDQESFSAASVIFSTIGVRKGLSFTDCTTLAVTRRLKIPLVASFDSGFDGLIERLS